MTIVGGLDVHRQQITFDYADSATGEVQRGRVVGGTREVLREWLHGVEGPGDFALEATTGWRYVAEELAAAGFQPHLADPAETAARKSPKRRAKTDKSDARHLRMLLAEGRLPEAWIPPAHILELRAQVRLRKSIVEERTEWTQRIRATLMHHGVMTPTAGVLALSSREWLLGLELSASARRTIDVGITMIDILSDQTAPIDRLVRTYARHQPGCRALTDLFGVGPLVAATILAELGDARRFSSSSKAVRYAGLDVTVHESDGKRARGHISRMGPEVLRWALFEAAESAAKRGSPDHADYVALKKRIGAGRTCLTIARKILRRAHHILVRLDDDAMAAPSVIEGVSPAA
jgi:transposase